MQTKAITSGQQVLLPESTRKQRKERKVTVAINSRDRNIGADYNTNQFRWSFRRALKDVTSIELVNGSVPADLYSVAPAWNTFVFDENNGSAAWKVVLTPGQYDAAALCLELQTRLNALPGVTNTYSVVYSVTTKKMTVTGTAAPSPVNYTFNFRSGRYIDEIDTHTGAIQSVNCPGRLFGFDYQDFSAMGSLTPPNRMDPYCLIGRLYLHLNADNSVEFNRVEMGAGRKDCFHILFLDQIRDGYYTLNKDIHMPIYYSSPAPVARIATLNISLRDEFYRPVDLGNHDFTLMFEITYLD